MKRYENKIYPMDLYLSTDISEFNKYFTDANGDSLCANDHTNATTYILINRKTNYPHIGILVNKSPNIGTIAHESFHATQFIMSYIGADFSMKSTNEPWAYLIEWIADCISEFIKENIK